jgi:hypothetical protein
VLIASPGDTVPVRWWLLQTLGADDHWSQRLVPSLGRSLSLTAGDTVGAVRIAITGISRTGVASAPAVWRVER